MEKGHSLERETAIHAVSTTSLSNERLFEGKTLCEGPTEEDEQRARICELARRLGYNEAKIRMKMGQWARNLAGLERELLDEIDTLPDELAGWHRKRRGG